MAWSGVTLSLILGLVALSRPVASNYGDSSQELLRDLALDDIRSDVERQVERQVEVDSYISALWTDIKLAIRSLERRAEEELSRKAKEISKRLPEPKDPLSRNDRQHPLNNFVRFGRSVPNDVSAVDSQDTNEDMVGGSVRNGRSVEEKDESNAMTKRKVLSNFVRIGRSMFKDGEDRQSRSAETYQDGAVDKRMLSNFVRFGRSTKQNGADGKQGKRCCRSHFLRFGRSVRGASPSSSQASGNDALFGLTSNNFQTHADADTAKGNFQKRYYGSAKIGRLPAAIFFQAPYVDRADADEAKVSPILSSMTRLPQVRPTLESLPRYG